MGFPSPKLTKKGIKYNSREEFIPNTNDVVETKACVVSTKLRRTVNTHLQDILFIRYSRETFLQYFQKKTFPTFDSKNLI